VGVENEKNGERGKAEGNVGRKNKTLKGAEKKRTSEGKEGRERWGGSQRRGEGEGREGREGREKRGR